MGLGCGFGDPLQRTVPKCPEKGALLRTGAAAGTCPWLVPWGFWYPGDFGSLGILVPQGFQHELPRDFFLQQPAPHCDQ